MNQYQRNEINRLRITGMPVPQIAESVGIPQGTIRSFIRRHPLSEITDICKNCGKPLVQTPGRKVRVFCCSQCKTSWWSSHRSEGIRRKTVISTCPVCGKEFRSYENDNRKYCSQSCYQKSRRT